MGGLREAPLPRRPLGRTPPLSRRAGEGNRRAPLRSPITTSRMQERDLQACQPLVGGTCPALDGPDGLRSASDSRRFDP